MKTVLMTVILAVSLALFVPSVVLADYLTDAVQALQHARVYVAPETEGTDRDTAAKLESRLDSNDNIVLVMLPTVAEKELGADIATIASRLYEMLPNKRVVGLAVGRRVVGYAPYLPAGVAADQMARADSVSNDSVTALSTFAQNMHIWQRQQPPPTPTPVPTPKPSHEPDKGNNSFLWLLLTAVFVVTIFIIVWRFLLTPVNQEGVPYAVDELLEKIEAQRNSINDRELDSKLQEMCLDIEKYFRSYCKNRRKDTRIFKGHLEKVALILGKYIDVQEYPRYYSNPRTLMDRGKAATVDFGEYVLASIKKGVDADLEKYNVQVDILSARRDWLRTP